MTNIQKEIPSITFIGVMTDIRKKISSITFTGIMTNIRKEIPSIIFTGIMTDIRKKIPSITFTGIMTNLGKILGKWEYTGKNCLGGTCHLKSTWLVTFLNYITGNETFDKRKTCKLSVWLMEVCRKSIRFRKRFRPNPLGLVQDLRESTRLGKTFARIHSAFDKTLARIHSAFDKRFARIHSAFDKHLTRVHQNPLGFTKNPPKSTGLIMSDISGPDTLGMTLSTIRR